MSTEKIGYFSAILQATLGAINTDKLFQIITFALSVVTALVTLIYNVWKWFKEAKKDGKITIEEIEAGLSIVKDEVQKIEESISKNEKEIHKNGD